VNGDELGPNAKSEEVSIVGKLVNAVAKISDKAQGADKMIAALVNLGKYAHTAVDLIKSLTP